MLFLYISHYSFSYLKIKLNSDLKTTKKKSHRTLNKNMDFKISHWYMVHNTQATTEQVMEQADEGNRQVKWGNLNCKAYWKYAYHSNSLQRTDFFMGTRSLIIWSLSSLSWQQAIENITIFLHKKLERNVHRGCEFPADQQQWTHNRMLIQPAKVIHLWIQQKKQHKVHTRLWWALVVVLENLLSEYCFRYMRK